MPYLLNEIGGRHWPLQRLQRGDITVNMGRIPPLYAAAPDWLDLAFGSSLQLCHGRHGLFATRLRHNLSGPVADLRKMRGDALW